MGIVPVSASSGGPGDSALTASSLRVRHRMEYDRGRDDSPDRGAHRAASLRITSLSTDRSREDSGRGEARRADAGAVEVQRRRRMARCQRLPRREIWVSADRLPITEPAVGYGATGAL